MANYNLPIFSHKMDFWIPGNNASLGGADVVGVWTQLYYGSRQTSLEKQIVTVADIRCPELRLDKAFVPLLPYPYVGGIWGFQDSLTNWWYYLVQFWDWQHVALPNEYLFMVLVQCDIFGVPPDFNR